MPGFPRLYTSLLLGRLGISMLSIALILFVLARFHSPQLAGLTAFISIFPGLAVSPVAGALLDRYGRARLIMLDYLIAAIAMAVIAALSALHALHPAVLLVISGVASLTNPLSAAGMRSLFPIVAPRHLWERANALDSSGYVLSSLVGAPLAGVLVSWPGPESALAATASVFVLAALAVFGMRDPSTPKPEQGSILEEAWAGLMYVVRRNATLRGLAITLSTYNMAWGVLEIAIPVLVLNRLHQPAATVGLIWGGLGAAGLVSALLSGRIKSQGRERRLMLGAIVVGTAAMAALPFAKSIYVVAAAVMVFGLSNGPFDIALFTLRQRVTDPAWLGRAFAVSMALNFVGAPIGSAFAGPIIGSSLSAALWLAVAIGVVSAFFPLLTIPRSEPRRLGLERDHRDQAADHVQPDSGGAADHLPAHDRPSAGQDAGDGKDVEDVAEGERDDDRDQPDDARR